MTLRGGGRSIGSSFVLTGIRCVPGDMNLLGNQANSSQSRAHISEEVLARAVGAGSRAGPTPIGPHVLQSCRQVGYLCT